MAEIKKQATAPEAHLASMLAESFNAHAGRPALFYKKDGEYRSTSYRRLRSDIEALGTALLEEGLLGKTFLIVGKGSYEWTLSALTLLFGIGVAVPLDRTASEDELLRLAEFSGAHAVFYDDGIDAIEALPASLVRIPFSSLSERMARGRKAINAGNHDFYRLKAEENTPALISFAAKKNTSPKGVMLSGANLCATLCALREVMPISNDDRFLSVLLPHHVYELTAGLLLPLLSGASVAFAEGWHTLIANMNEVHPTAMVAVPAIVEALCRRVRSKLGGFDESLSKLGSAALGLLPFDTEMAAKKKLFAELHASFGGELSYILCGGAPVDGEVLRTLMSIGLPVFECYSISECAGMATLNIPSAYQIGSAGKKLPYLTVDIYNKGADGKGEIRIKSPAVMLGYLGDPALTGEVLRDGWLYTGDIGSIDKDGFLTVIGRKRNMMVTAGGKSIYPEELEQLLGRSRFVRESVVVGFVNENKRVYDLVAVIRPDLSQIEQVYGKDYSLLDIETEMQSVLDSVNATLPEHKRLMTFVLREQPFERNSARKLRRSGVAASVLAAYKKSLGE